MSKMDAISDYHMEDFDIKVQPGVTREGLNHHIKNDGKIVPRNLHTGPHKPAQKKYVYINVVLSFINNIIAIRIMVPR